MTVRNVHWHEGMFLKPHLFQTAQRYQAYVAARNEKWDLNYNWGVRAIDLDRDALSNYRLVIRSLQVRLRDGTNVSVPEDGVLQVMDLNSGATTTSRCFSACRSRTSRIEKAIWWSITQCVPFRFAGCRKPTRSR
jgi:predicted component of type VI protein secretion system